MSLQTDGVWKAAVWAGTVWAQDVWFEGSSPQPPAVQTPSKSIDGGGGFSRSKTRKVADPDAEVMEILKMVMPYIRGRR